MHDEHKDPGAIRTAGPKLNPADGLSGGQTPSRGVRFVLGPEPWGGMRQPALQRWALARARRDLVVYLGPQVMVPDVAVGDAGLGAATRAEVVQRWIQLAGHQVRGVYVIPRLDHVRLTTRPESPEVMSGALEYWLVVHTRGPWQVVFGYREARWLGPPPRDTWTWSPDPDGVAPTPLVPAPWPTVPEHPLAVVVGARAPHASWLNDLARRAPHWRWLVSGANLGAPWPAHASVDAWPRAVDAWAQVRAAVCMVVPPTADTAAVAAWRDVPEARRLPWVGTDAVPKGLPAVELRDYARALACLTWAEPQGLTQASS